MNRYQHPNNRPACVEEHAEEYREVSFAVRRLAPGADLICILEGGHQRLLGDQIFDRFKTEAELAERQDIKKAAQAMRNAIDRMINCAPIYRGDLRERFSKCA